VRHLGPEQFGIYSYAISFVMLFSILAKLGLTNFIVKEMVDKRNDQITILNTAFSLKLFGSVLIFFVMLVVSWVFGHDRITSLYIAIIGIGMVFQSFEVVEFYCQAIVNIRPIVVAKVIQLASSSVLKIALLLLDADLLYFVVVALFDVVALSFAYILIHRTLTGTSMRISVDPGIATRLLGMAWPVALSNMAMMAYTRMDQIMLFNMEDAASVGIYASATRISEAW